MTDAPQYQRQVYSVSQLTLKIKGLLENQFPFVWVAGEISNFSRPASGHYYFTLKDLDAQIQAVMFKGQNQHLDFIPENGMHITGLGRLSVYEPRGSYQIIFELVEPKGIGAIQIAFEQLKTKLSNEGLFDRKYKKPLPFLPQKICIITSPTGSVVLDFIRIVHRRFANIIIDIIPTAVQGQQSAAQIAECIAMANDLNDVDVIVLARGGGSMEDLQAFNSEDVARAIFNSILPVISAIGHETDFTIADFVADLRAPTPSAAAEMIVPDQLELEMRRMETHKRLQNAFNQYIEKIRLQLNSFGVRLVHPKKQIQNLLIKIDDLVYRQDLALQRIVEQQQDQLTLLNNNLQHCNPKDKIVKYNDYLLFIKHKLISHFKNYIDLHSHQLTKLTTLLNAMNPKDILARGYSITQRLPDMRIVRDPNHVKIDQNIKVLVEKGEITCRVERK